jgi:peptide-methionine (S)-S-oxide reductase
MLTKRFFAYLWLLSGLLLLAGQTVTAAAAEKSVAIFAGGCFWCVESDFDKVPGVISTTSGYIGGAASTAAYKKVTAGGTGHYEAVRIVFDPSKVTYDRLLHIFWRSVDPTDPGGQFCDRGDSYKTAIFATSDAQAKLARKSKSKAQAALGKTIVTPIRSAGKFYAAEGYHQNYYQRNPTRYKIYRYGCGRDARIKELWGSEALAGIKH